MVDSDATIAKTSKPPSYGKSVLFELVRFQPRIIMRVIEEFIKTVEADKLTINAETISYEDEHGNSTHIRNPSEQEKEMCFANERWRYFSTSSSNPYINISYKRSALEISASDFSSMQSVNLLVDILNANLAVSKLPERDVLKEVCVFIGHGRSQAWQQLKSHLTDHHGIKVEAYETGARAGYSIQEILLEMSNKSTLALLVHTAEDTDGEGALHARENVVHETGLFQGKLGFRKAIVIQEKGTAEFSNIAGLQQIRFSPGNIKETYGDVLAVIRREFTAEGR